MTDVVDSVATRVDARRHVLLTAPTFEPGFRGGGPVRSVARIIDTAPRDADLTVVTRDRDLGSHEPYPGLSGQWVTRGQARIFYLNTRSIRQWGRLIRTIRGERYDLLYVNSMWEPVLSLLPVLASIVGIVRTRQVLVAPRGELADGALSLKSTKKRLALKVLRRVYRRDHLIWHASTDLEAAEIRAHFSRPRIQICMMEVSRVRPAVPHRPVIEGVTKLVYISRISPKKNLHTTLAALGLVTNPVVFDIYGPIGDERYWSKCQKLMSALPDHVKATYQGELTPNRVVTTFAQYDAFVFPTLGENFGHVIAESLAAGCAVICSGLTPWTPVLLAGGGVVVDDALDPHSVARAIDNWTSDNAPARYETLRAVDAAYETWLAQNDDENVIDIVLQPRVRAAR